MSFAHFSNAVEFSEFLKIYIPKDSIASYSAMKTHGRNWQKLFIQEETQMTFGVCLCMGKTKLIALKSFFFPHY